ncbi:hypothetical protein QOZ80_6AG0517360 [Eleusine coracana subsp. coracana]|nr:hypothetical protein QOZ80_6AG0517360 [Eleusine coracana subsp. coracana]
MQNPDAIVVALDSERGDHHVWLCVTVATTELARMARHADEAHDPVAEMREHSAARTVERGETINASRRRHPVLVLIVIMDQLVGVDSAAAEDVDSVIFFHVHATLFDGSVLLGVVVGGHDVPGVGGAVEGIIKILGIGDGELAAVVYDFRVLHWAAYQGHLEVCKYLLEEHGVDVNMAGPDEGVTPLMTAAMSDHISVVKYLLDCGGDSMQPDENGATALHHAAGEGSSKVTEFLLSKGIPVDIDFNGRGTPLLSSIKCTSIPCSLPKMCEEANDVEDLEHVFKDANAKPVKISYAVLKSITKNFGQVIGRGGFGVVYLGELRNGMVAVKMLSTHMDLSDKSFSDEFGNLIRLKHKHIDYLKEKSYGFEWSMRYQIIKGIYFGMSRCFDGNISTMVTKNMFGTLGYIAPEFIEKGQISSKSDIYSFGLIMIKLMLGSSMIKDNWHELLDVNCPQMKSCIEIAQRCIDRDPKNRPTIGHIIDRLNEEAEITDAPVVITNEPRNNPESSLYQTVNPTIDPRAAEIKGRSMKMVVRKFRESSLQTDNQHSRDSLSLPAGGASKQGSIAAFATYRPPLPWDIFSCPIPPSSDNDELQLADGISYNYNCRPIPVMALKALVAKKPDLASETGETEQLTPDGQYDLSPAVSPSGNKVAVASFRGNTWTGEIELLKTSIVVMNVDRKVHGGKLQRSNPIAENGGWPSWGSDSVIFFHRGICMVDPANGRVTTHWGVFRYDITTNQIVRVTPEALDAMTPAAISETKVAVATIRQRAKQLTDQREELQYRHIEIFDLAMPEQPSVKITKNIFPKADYYNPFILDGGCRIGYHRVRKDEMIHQDGKNCTPRNFEKLQSPNEDIELFRVSGSVVCPAISPDGSKLAFLDSEFKAVWLADKQGVRIIWQKREANSIISATWNNNPEKDILYVCVGSSFNSCSTLEIYAIFHASGTGGQQRKQRLTDGGFNNAFPSSNPDGTKIVFRSTRDHTTDAFRYKNLYIMEDAEAGEYEDAVVTRLTDGAWTDTHCQWSPRGNWIVFSSTRDKPAMAPMLDNGIDLGHYAVYLVNTTDPTVVVRVVTSAEPTRGASSISGHINHPVFSPDGRSIAFTADLAAVSVEPISLPVFLHPVRPYGDIFYVEIDPNDIMKNKDIKKFHRVTHSRHEYATSVWTKVSTHELNAQWNMLLMGTDAKTANYKPACPYVHHDGGEGWYMTGHIIVPRRCC